jgi:opacity protein-like surface antigen
MTRILRIAVLALLAAAPARAADLPFFAGGGGAPYDAPPVLQRWDAPPPSDPWTGLVVGSSLFGAAGAGRGSRGGFGGDAFVGYNKEFDNRVIVGVQASAGYIPGLYQYGPRGYDFGLAQLQVGYDLGRLMPYVSVGAGLARPTSALNGAPTGFAALNDLSASGQPTTSIATVGVGVNYAVTDHLVVGVGINAVQQRGGWGPPLIPQPGMP